MGIKSTYTLNRSVAQEIIIEKINKNFSQLSDEQVANILECFPESKYRNYCIGDSTEDDFDFGYDFVITDFYDFKNKL